jgi:hypothetical protein
VAAAVRTHTVPRIARLASKPRRRLNVCGCLQSLVTQFSQRLGKKWCGDGSTPKCGEASEDRSQGIHWFCRRRAERREAPTDPRFHVVDPREEGGGGQVVGSTDAIRSRGCFEVTEQVTHHAVRSDLDQRVEVRAILLHHHPHGGDTPASAADPPPSRACPCEWTDKMATGFVHLSNATRGTWISNTQIGTNTCRQCRGRLYEHVF